jgi:hypothetical protein
MLFCSKCSEGILCSDSCSLSPNTIVTSSRLTPFKTGGLLLYPNLLKWGKAASHAAFYFPSQHNRR